MAQNSVKAFPLSTVLSSTVTALYTPLNSIGFPGGPFLLRITNASSMPITLSYNGVDDHEFITANTVFVLETQTNSQPAAQVALLPKHTIVYIKGTAGTGSIYLSGYYV